MQAAGTTPDTKGDLGRWGTTQGPPRRLGISHNPEALYNADGQARKHAFNCISLSRKMGGDQEQNGFKVEQ